MNVKERIEEARREWNPSPEEVALIREVLQGLKRVRPEVHRLWMKLEKARLGDHYALQRYVGDASINLRDAEKLATHYL
jgi:hypothetical protein